MIGWLVFAATQVVALAVMRPVYGLLRAQAIDGHAKLRRHQDPVVTYNDLDRGVTVFISVVFSLLWPVALLCFGLYHGGRLWMFGTKIASSWEKDHALTQATLRVSELERELGMHGDNVARDISRWDPMDPRWR